MYASTTTCLLQVVALYKITEVHLACNTVLDLLHRISSCA